ncbi:MAG: hypothetical protein ACTS8H_02045 [Arsenophonus sp. NC-PE1-MAG3]
MVLLGANRGIAIQKNNKFSEKIINYTKIKGINMVVNLISSDYLNKD